MASTTAKATHVWTLEGFVGICASVTVVIVAAGLLRQKVFKPMLEITRLVTTLAKQLIGDKDAKPPRPSLMEMVADVQAGLKQQAVVQEQQALRLEQVEQGQAELRQEWQTFRARSPVPPKPNGQGRR